MKIKQLLLMGLLASGLVLSGCGSSGGSSIATSSQETSSQKTSSEEASSEEESSEVSSEEASSEDVSSQEESSEESSSQEAQFINLAGNTFTFTSVQDYTSLRDVHSYINPYIGSTIAFDNEGNFAWTVDRFMGNDYAIAYGNYIQVEEDAEYTLKGLIIGETDNKYPEDIQQALPIEVSLKSIILASQISVPEYSGYVYLVGELTEAATYEQFEADFNNKEDAPYNYLEYYYNDDNTGAKPLKGVEHLIDGVWTVDQEETEEGMGDVTPNIIIPLEVIKTYVEREGVENTFTYVNGKYTWHAQQIVDGNKMELFAMFDEYFYIYSFANGQNDVTRLACQAFWSVLL